MTDTPSQSAESAESPRPASEPADAPGDSSAPKAGSEPIGTPVEPEQSTPEETAARQAAIPFANPEHRPKPGEGLVERMLRWPGRAKADVEERWALIAQEAERVHAGPVQRTLFFIKIILLHTRYIFGYLAAGFLVSAPLYLGTHEGWNGATMIRLWRCAVLGGICLVPFLILIPVTRIDWHDMRLPEFKIFELALTRWASYFAGGYLLVSFWVTAVAAGDILLFDRQIAWVNFVLMVTAWARIKLQTLIFKDFYSLENYDGLVLLPPSVRGADTEQDKTAGSGDSKAPGDSSATGSDELPADGIGEAPSGASRDATAGRNDASSTKAGS